MKQSYSLGDIHRILLGRAPWSFLLEVLLRTCIVYAALMIVVPLLGKRMSGQVSNLEMAVMLVLGAIVSAPMQVAEQGMAPSLLLLVWLLVLQRALSAASTRSAGFEHTIFGRTTILVKDGELELQNMKEARVSREQLFATLRTRKYRHLGEIARVYLESSGSFSIFRNPNPKPGASLSPPFDRDREPGQPVRNGIPAESRS